MDALTYAEQVLWPTQARSSGNCDLATVRDLEAQLKAAKSELESVKNELADKVEQLYHVTSTQNQSAYESNKLEQQLQELVSAKHALEEKLAARDKELEELGRVHNAQKKELRDLQDASAEHRATQDAEEEVLRSAAQLVVDDELERLSMSLSTLQTRSQMELAAKDSELRRLRQQLQDAIQQRDDAVDEMERSLTNQMQQQVERARMESAERMAELEQEVVWLRTRMEDIEREEQKMDLPRELAALNNQKVQIQREFEAFRELIGHTTRQSREETARLLDENAALRSKLASLTVAQISARPAVAYTAGAPHLVQRAAKGRTFLPQSSFVPDFLLELDRHRQGLAPMSLIAIIVCLVVLLAVVRAAVSTHGAHPVLCFLSKLGIQIGNGCGGVLEEAKEELEKIIEKPQRVHDVPTTSNQGAGVVGRALLNLLHRRGLGADVP